MSRIVNTLQFFGGWEGNKGDLGRRTNSREVNLMPCSTKKKKSKKSGNTERKIKWKKVQAKAPKYSSKPEKESET